MVRIVIDIPEETYELYKKALATGMGNSAMDYIVKGTFLKANNCDNCEEKAKSYTMGFNDGFVTGKETASINAWIDEDIDK